MRLGDGCIMGRANIYLPIQGQASAMDGAVTAAITMVVIEDVAMVANKTW
jgi:hypothetical protein